MTIKFFRPRGRVARQAVAGPEGPVKADSGPVNVEGGPPLAPGYIG